MGRRYFLRTIAVLGAGQMGSGIAQLCAERGLSVHLVDVHSEVLKTARQKIHLSLSKRFAKEDISDAPDVILKRMHFSSEMSVIKDCGIVIEAVPEDIKLKKQVLSRVSKMVHPQVVIASNTSSISIASLGVATGRPEQTIGLHFMNPAPLMPLVEVIRSEQTSDEVFNKCLQLVEFLGKQAVASKDQPGFIVNRILMPMINEAARAFQEGVASAQEIDQAMQLGCRHPMGPLALADLIGLDTCVSIMEVLQKGLGDCYRPCAVLKKYVSEGRLGKKTKKGFYNYEK